MNAPASTLSLLVPTDMSPASAPAVICAFDLSRRLRAELELFYVLPEQTVDQNVMAGRSAERQMAEAHVALSAWLAASILRSERAGIPVKVNIGVGRPAVAILAKAKSLNAFMIIMGTHGRTRLTRAVLGSVAEEVARHAACPVLIVRAESVPAA